MLDIVFISRKNDQQYDHFVLLTSTKLIHNGFDDSSKDEIVHAGN